MKIFADYHTHTKYSHGIGTIQENVEVAVKKGLREIAITDHGPRHLLYGIKTKYLQQMRNEVDIINQSSYPIKVKLGLEANIISIDGKLDVDEEITNQLDIILAGYHFGAWPKNVIQGARIHGNNLLARYFPTVESKVRVLNTQAVVEAIYKNNIDILTHPGAKANIDTKEVAKAAAQRGTALEINSSHGYLTVEYIEIAMKEGAKFVINSDAHRPEDVGNVQQGIQRALTAGLQAEQIINVEQDEGGRL